MPNEFGTENSVRKSRRLPYLALALVLGGCQIRVAAPATPGTLRFPDVEVAHGVDAFRASVAKGGMVGVARDLQKCQGTMAPAAPADLVRKCFALEMASFLVATAHEARTRSAPLPGLSQAEFSRRLDGYCGRLRISPQACPATRAAMLEQVGTKLGS